MVKVITDLYGSFSNSNDGFSAKKLTAFILTLTFCYSHRFVNEVNLIGVLGVDAGLITLLFGVNVYDKLKNKENDTNTIDTTITSTTHETT
jgi:hypothetical protein